MSGRYTPTKLTPKARAQRIFNRMTDYCCAYYKGVCAKCGYTHYCEKLAEVGIRPSDEIMYAQRTKEQRTKITDAINKFDRTKREGKNKCL